MIIESMNISEKFDAVFNAIQTAQKRYAEKRGDPENVLVSALTKILAFTQQKTTAKWTCPGKVEGLLILEVALTLYTLSKPRDFCRRRMSDMHWLRPVFFGPSQKTS